MKKITLLLTIPLLSVLFLAFQSPTGTEIEDICHSKESKQKCKNALSPFKFDASKTTKFTLRTKEQHREIEVPLFSGEKYKFIFNTEGCPNDVKIEVYNKKSTSKKRVLLWSSADQDPEAKQMAFTPEKSRQMYVNYTIPAYTETAIKGCVVFTVGYMSKFN